MQKVLQVVVALEDRLANAGSTQGHPRVGIVSGVVPTFTCPAATATVSPGLALFSAICMAVLSAGTLMTAPEATGNSDRRAAASRATLKDSSG